MRWAALVVLLAMPVAAKELPAPDTRKLQARAALGPLEADPNPAARCQGFFYAVEFMARELPRAAEQGLLDQWPGETPNPFEWVSDPEIAAWRQDHSAAGDRGHLQLYFDAFGGLTWTVANLSIYQRDKEACLHLIARGP